VPDPSSVRSLFTDLAPSYDRYNRIFSLGLDILWRNRLVQAVALNQPSSVLDVACGSGDVALALQKKLPDANVTALDFCVPLLAQAKSRGVKHVVEGDALHLPFPDQSFSVVTLAFGLRNFSDRRQGLSEIARVLKPGGVFGLLEFSPPPYPWRLFWDLYLSWIMPAIAELLTRQGKSFRYLADSISEFPTPESLTQEISQSGLKQVEGQPMAGGLVHLSLSVKPTVP